MSRAPARSAPRTGRGPRRGAALALAAALAAGCSHRAAPTAPVAPVRPAPRLVATEPPARSLGVLYDTDIWAQFDRPLDPATLNPKNVYLELDTQRQPVTVSYQAINRRVTLVPGVTLALEHTYTVEFSTNVHEADGTPLPPGVFFQFTTNSLRRVQYLYPAPDAQEGPFVTLGWGGNGPPVDSVFYDVYAGTDSAAVATRASATLQHLPFVQLLPRTRWPSGALVYWAVTAENERTRERLNGALQRFQTLAATTPVDSVTIPVFDWGGSHRQPIGVSQYCGDVQIGTGPDYSGGIHWDVGTIPTGAHLAGARIVLTTDSTSASQLATYQPRAFLPTLEWVSCTCGYPGPPYAEPNGLMSGGVAIAPAGTVQFGDDGVASYLEAVLRGRFTGGMVFTAASNLLYFSGSGQNAVAVRPHAVVRYYRSGS